MERKKLYKAFSGSIKDADVKQGVIKGLFAHFDSKDKHGDIILKGAFKKTIKELGPQGTDEIAHLLDHKGDHAVAKINELSEAEGGLRYVSTIGTHNAGQDFLKMVESGIIKFHSIGYSPIKEEYDRELNVNFLKEIKLYEGSSLQFIAANHNTPILDLKSFDDEIEAFKFLDLLEKFIKTTDCTDETIIKLENKFKSLSELLKPLDDTSKNQEADEDKIKQILKSFGNYEH